MYTLSTHTICTECTLKRVQAVVKVLQDKGWNIEYGEKTNIPKSQEFTNAFYDAIDQVDYKS